MSFLFQGQAPSIYFDQDNQRTTRVRGIETVIASITGFTPTTNTTVLKTVTVNGLNVPVTASGIPGDAVIAQPMAALGTGNTVIGSAYVSAANTVTIPFITVGTATAIATQNYLITVLKLGQLD